MTISKKIILVIIIVIIGIQFVQPEKNKSTSANAHTIAATYSIPERVQLLLKNSCYDCHSNNTRYPWYTHIQPVGWLLARDIRHGKAKLNFDEFGAYSSRVQRSKLKEIKSSIKDKSMPLPAYLIMHKEARLTNKDEAEMLGWVENVYDSLTQF